MTVTELIERLKMIPNPDKSKVFVLSTVSLQPREIVGMPVIEVSRMDVNGDDAHVCLLDVDRTRCPILGER